MQGLNPVIFTSLQRNVARLLERNSINNQIERQTVKKINLHISCFELALRKERFKRTLVMPINFLKKIHAIACVRFIDRNVFPDQEIKSTNCKRKRHFDSRSQTAIAHRVTFPARNFLPVKRCKSMRRITSGFNWVLTHKMSLVIV